MTTKVLIVYQPLIQLRGQYETVLTYLIYTLKYIRHGHHELVHLQEINLKIGLHCVSIHTLAIDQDLYLTSQTLIMLIHQPHYIYVYV